MLTGLSFGDGGLHASRCYSRGSAAGCRRCCRGALGVRLLDEYLEFVDGRCRPNTVLAVAYDLKVFLTTVGKPHARWRKFFELPIDLSTRSNLDSRPRLSTRTSSHRTPVLPIE